MVAPVDRLNVFENGSWVFIFFAVIALLFTLPIFFSIDNWGGVGDWDLHTFFQAVPRMTIIDYQQFPLWNPYHCGGSPALAYPQSYFLSPVFSLILIFGEIRGLKIEIWLLISLGMYGIFLVARYYKLDKSSSIIASWLKIYLHRGEMPALYYWRSRGGPEVDLIIERNGVIYPFEVKSTSTVTSKSSASLKKWLDISGVKEGRIIADIEETIPVVPGVTALPWKRF